MLRIRTLSVIATALLLGACGGSEPELTTGTAAGTASSSGIAKAMGTTTVGGWQVTVSELGMLTGGTIASARAINNTGKVVGIATDASYAINRVLWDVSGSVAGAPSLAYGGSGGIDPTSLNDFNELAGTHRISASQRQADYWSGPKYTVITLMPLAGGSSNLTTARAINAAGTIAGTSPDSGGVMTAVTWKRDGAPMTLQIAGEGFGINNLGHVVGVTGGVVTRGFLWRNGPKLELVSLSGSGSSARALAVSDTGYIAGTSDNGTIAVRWRYNIDGSGSVTAEALPLPTGLVTPSPAAVNDNGDVVGSAWTSNYNGTRAVLWRNGQLIQLATYTSMAFGINNAGQIVGEGDANGDGRTEALLWTVTSGTATTTPPPPVVDSPSNTVPTATIAVNTTSLKIGETLNVQGSFKDPDQGPWTYTIDWGDGSSRASGSVNAAGTVGASHVYSTASPRKSGYKVVFTVKDAAGASASVSKSIKVSR